MEQILQWHGMWYRWCESHQSYHPADKDGRLWQPHSCIKSHGHCATTPRGTCQRRK